MRASATDLESLQNNICAPPTFPRMLLSRSRLQKEWLCEAKRSELNDCDRLTWPPLEARLKESVTPAVEGGEAGENLRAGAGTRHNSHTGEPSQEHVLSFLCCFDGARLRACGSSVCHRPVHSAANRSEVSSPEVG